MLVTILFKLSALLSIQLIALTSAIFLFIYIKKHDLTKWYTFIATAIIGFVLLIMLATFVGVIAMAGRHQQNSNNRRDEFAHHPMRHHWRHHQYNNFENENNNWPTHENRNWDKEEEHNQENKEETNGEMGKDFHRRWHRHHQSDWGMSENKTIDAKDSLTKSKAFKK